MYKNLCNAWCMVGSIQMWNIVNGMPQKNPAVNITLNGGKEINIMKF